MYTGEDKICLSCVCLCSPVGQDKEGCAQVISSVGSFPEFFTWKTISMALNLGHCLAQSSDMDSLW